MRKIRIGKDIKIRWAVLIEGEIADPAKHDLTLELRDSFGSTVEVAQPTLVDGLLETIFYGKDHKRTGVYRLTLWLNKGKEGQSVVDACDAFTLVSCSCEEGGEGDLDLEVVDVETASLDVGGSSGGSGVSSYAALPDKPKINGMTLVGDKSAEELNLQPKGEYPSVEEVNEALNALAQRIPTDYITEDDLSGYAKTSDIPSVQGLASEDYVQEQIAENSGFEVVSQTETTATIQPNVLNVWGEVASLNLSFAVGEEGKVNEYLVQFTSGATATTLVLPDTIQWMAAPNVQANKTYQLSVVNNLGIIAEFG